MKMLKSNKGSVFDSITSLAVGVVGLAIVLVIAFLIVASGKSQIDAIEGNTVSYGHNASNTLQSALSEIPGWVPIIIETKQETSCLL